MTTPVTVNYNLTTAERLIKAKVELNRTHSFFAYILMHMKIENTKHTDRIPTMAVSQYGDLYWNKEFIDKLTNDELRFCLAHEVGHVATLTFQRQDFRDDTIWNIATDLCINFMLLEEGFSAPQGILLPNHQGLYTFTSGKTKKDITINLNDKNAEQVYDDLYKNAKVIKQIVNADGNGNYDGQLDGHIEGDNDDAGNSTGKGSDKKSQKANENAWKRKAVEGVTQAKMRGSISAGMERMINDILEPVVDWRNKLFAYITND